MLDIHGYLHLLTGLEKHVQRAGPLPMSIPQAIPNSIHSHNSVLDTPDWPVPSLVMCTHFSSAESAMAVIENSQFKMYLFFFITFDHCIHVVSAYL